MNTPAPENALLARLRHADAALRRLAVLDLAESNDEDAINGRCQVRCRIFSFEFV
jgi:hypothetical protein